MSLAYVDLGTALSRGAPELGREAEDDRLVATMRDISPVPVREKQRVVMEVTQLLREVGTSPRVCNAAAILLTDLIGRDAQDDIVAVLRRPGSAKSSGSLLFALNEVGASIPLDLALRLIEGGSLEAQGEVLTLLEDGRVSPLDAETIFGAKATLASLKDHDDPKVVHAAEMALEYLDDLAPEASPRPSI